MIALELSAIPKQQEVAAQLAVAAAEHQAASKFAISNFEIGYSSRAAAAL